MRDCAWDGVRWWSRVRLDGYARTIVAGALAPAEATGAALLVLYPACRRSGAPETLLSESGGAFTADAFAAVGRRLEMQPEPMVSTPGERYKNLMDTHFHSQRRLLDSQFSWTQTPAELAQGQHRFLQTSNTTAQEG
jgi:hypothetical protein